MLPAKHAQVFQTRNGTRYLKGPGVVLIAHTTTDLSGIQPFLDGFDSELGFQPYLSDPTPLPPATQLIKFSGQLCYLSLGDKRTWNKDAKGYFDNIKKSRHGSVLEHASFSFLLYGVPRSFTHELVRHRVASYSQVSQRYVDASVVRFVERPEYQQDEVLHRGFEDWIDQCRAKYEDRTQALLALQGRGEQLLSGEKKRDLRKKVQQCARSCLPNEVEAPIVVSLNIRSLRHVIEMRADSPADIEIRAVAYQMYQLVSQLEPILFDDYQKVDLPDGVPAVTTEFRKV